MGIHRMLTTSSPNMDPSLQIDLSTGSSMADGMDRNAEMPSSATWGMTPSMLHRPHGRPTNRQMTPVKFVHAV